MYVYVCVYAVITDESGPLTTEEDFPEVDSNEVNQYSLDILSTCTLFLSIRMYVYIHVHVW